MYQEIASFTDIGGDEVRVTVDDTHVVVRVTDTTAGPDVVEGYAVLEPEDAEDLAAALLLASRRVGQA